MKVGSPLRNTPYAPPLPAFLQVQKGLTREAHACTLRRQDRVLWVTRWFSASQKRGLVNWSIAHSISSH